MRFKILHIGDLHSRFEELARLSTAIREIKDENTVILEAGDNADFMRLETEGTKGEIAAGLLSEIGFDAMVFGNNEGFAGKEKGAVISKASNFPVLTCNLYDENDKSLEYLQDATIINRNGLRILTIGVTAPYNDFYNLMDIYAKDPIDEIIRVLKGYDKTQYDIVLLLSHLGLRSDERIANKIEEIDIIVGGHSHIPLYDPVIVNDTIIHQAGKYGRYLGEIVFNYDFEKKEITEYEARLIRGSKYDKDDKICELIEEYAIVANKNLSKPLFNIDRHLSHSNSRENEMGNLLADALMDVLDTDLGMINSGVMNKGIEKGEVSRKILLEVCPSPLNPTYVEVQGKDIITTLEKSLLSEYYNSDGKGSGFRGSCLGNICVSDNVKVIYKEDGEDFNKIESVTINGEEIESEKWYTLGTSDYLQRGTGYSDLANCKNERYNPEELKDTLQEYIKKEEFLKKSFNRRFIKK